MLVFVKINLKIVLHLISTMKYRMVIDTLRLYKVLCAAIYDWDVGHLVSSGKRQGVLHPSIFEWIYILRPEVPSTTIISIQELQKRLGRNIHYKLDFFKIRVYTSKFLVYSYIDF